MLHRRSPYYRSLPLTIKTLGYVMVITAGVALQAERRGLQYDMEHNWCVCFSIRIFPAYGSLRVSVVSESAGKRQMDHEEAEALARWNALSPMQKAGDWPLRHRWHLFMAGWASTMGISWMVLRRNKTQTFAQKIVQARVYVSALSGFIVGFFLSIFLILLFFRHRESRLLDCLEALRLRRCSLLR